MSKALQRIFRRPSRADLAVSTTDSAETTDSASASVTYGALPDDWPAARQRLQEIVQQLRTMIDSTHEALLKQIKAVEANVRQAERKAAADVVELRRLLRTQAANQRRIDGRGFVVAGVGVLVSGASQEIAVSAHEIPQV